MKPRYLLFAGPNGAGKSTYFNSLYWQNFLNIKYYVRINPDETIQEYGLDSQSKSDQLKAAKICIKHLNDALANNKNIVQETTLCGKTIIEKIRQAKAKGYNISVIYIGVNSPEICIDRIRNRVHYGGHYIDDATVEKRYFESLNKLKSIKDLSDNLILVDNSTDYVPLMILNNDDIEILNPNFEKYSWVTVIAKTIDELSYLNYNEETIKVLEDAKNGKNIIGPFSTVEEAFKSIFEE